MSRCLAEARSAGFETVWLGVWERNASAATFYERWGFSASGEHVFMLGSDPQTDVIMERGLGPAGGEEGRVTTPQREQGS